MTDDFSGNTTPLTGEESINDAQNASNAGISDTSTGQSRDDNYKVGPGKPPKHSQFTSENQPDKAKEIKTRKIKKQGRELLREMLNMRYAFAEDSQIAKQLVATFGKSVLKCTVLEIATLQQFNKAILKGDTQAYMALLNQSHGLPKQIMEHMGANGGPIQTQEVTTQVIIENPHAGTGQ